MSDASGIRKRPERERKPSSKISDYDFSGAHGKDDEFDHILEGEYEGEEEDDDDDEEYLGSGSEADQRGDVEEHYTPRGGSRRRAAGATEPTEDNSEEVSKWSAIQQGVGQGPSRKLTAAGAIDNCRRNLALTEELLKEKPDDRPILVMHAVNATGLGNALRLNRVRI